MSEAIWQAIGAHIEQAGGAPFQAQAPRSVGGGSINAAYVVGAAEQRYFVKLNAAAQVDMFEAEAQGLAELAAPAVIRVPQPLCWGTADGRSYLVLEYISMGGGSARAIERLGEQLAALHRVRSERFGWHRDNTIGSTPQPNAWSEQWLSFLRERRLGFQLDLARRNGYGGRLYERGQRLLEHLEDFFSDYQPLPSLLHGDLWSGNYAISADEEPVIFDPAVYYGDREADLAMTELFGGFPARFYDAYQAAYPLDPGYRTRKTLYNLYHIVNHLNLFGGGYRGQAEGMIDRLLGLVG